MHQFRVTKYNPSFRKKNGAHGRDECTSRLDIGRAIPGTVLTQDAYETMENAYAAFALAFLRHSSIDTLKVCGHVAGAFQLGAIRVS